MPDSEVNQMQPPANGQAPAPPTNGVHAPDTGLLNQLKLRALEQINQLVPTPTQKRTYSYAELYAKKDIAQPFLVPDLIPAQSVTVMIGEDGIGKTQLCTQICLHLAFKYSKFLGMPLKGEHGNCLIVATEDSKQKFITACAKQAHALEPGHRPQDVGIDFTEGSDFDDLLEMKTEMEAMLDKKFYDLIIVDALGDLFTLIDGEINSNSHARKIISFFQHLCNKYTTTIIIIHHAAKTKIVAKQKEGKLFVEKTDSQGAGSITQKPRTVLALSNDPRSTAPDGSRYTNYLHVVKANLMGKEYAENAIKLQFDLATLLHAQQGRVNIHMLQEEAEKEAQAQGTTLSNNGNTRKRQAKDYDDIYHTTKIREVFREDEALDKKELKTRMAAQYEVGMNKIEAKDGYFAYCEQRGFFHGSIFGYKLGPAPAAPASDDNPDDTLF